MNENNLLSVAFPTLDETQISQLARCTHAEPKLFRDGQTLFAVGDRNMNFFVVKSGKVEIVDYSGDEPKDPHDPSPRRVHGRHLACDWPPSHRQRSRPG